MVSAVDTLLMLVGELEGDFIGLKIGAIVHISIVCIEGEGSD